jgi:hypothetical protein
MVAAMIGTTVVAHLVLRATFGGPPVPRVLFSLTCGVIAAGALSFIRLL